MLLAAQQPLPSRALKAKPVRRWGPEERREGFLGLYRSRGNRTGHGRWGYPPSRAGRPAELPLPPQGCAHSPPSGSGVLFRRGPGPCSTPGSGPRTARRGGPGRSGGCPTAAGDLPRSGNPSGAPAGLPQGKPCENGWCDIPGLVQVLYTWSSPRVSAFGEGRGAVVTIVANALHPREGYRLTGGDRPGTPPGSARIQQVWSSGWGRRLCQHRAPLKAAERGSASLSFHTCQITAVISRAGGSACKKQSNRSEPQRGQTCGTPAGLSPSRRRFSPAPGERRPMIWVQGPRYSR